MIKENCLFKWNLKVTLHVEMKDIWKREKAYQVYHPLGHFHVTCKCHLSNLFRKWDVEKILVFVLFSRRKYDRLITLVPSPRLRPAESDPSKAKRFMLLSRAFFQWCCAVLNSFLSWFLSSELFQILFMIPSGSLSPYFSLNYHWLVLMQAEPNDIVFGA